MTHLTHLIVGTASIPYHYLTRCGRRVTRDRGDYVYEEAHAERITCPTCADGLRANLRRAASQRRLA